MRSPEWFTSRAPMRRPLSLIFACLVGFITAEDDCEHRIRIVAKICDTNGGGSVECEQATKDILRSHGCSTHLSVSTENGTGNMLNSECFTQRMKDKMLLLENTDSNVKFWRMKILVRVYESKKLSTRSGKLQRLRDYTIRKIMMKFYSGKLQSGT